MYGTYIATLLGLATMNGSDILTMMLVTRKVVTTNKGKMHQSNILMGHLHIEG
jgi:hypothetical protein